MLLAASIARKLSLRPGHNRKSSAGAIIAVAGIALALAIMLAAVAIVTGFKHEIEGKVMGFNAQISLYPSDVYSDTTYSSGVKLTTELRKTIEEVVPESFTALTIRQPAIFKTNDAFQGVVLKGSQGSQYLNFIASNLKDGELLPESPVDSLSNSVIISAVTARELNLNVGDRIDTHFLIDDQLLTRKLTVRGIYDTHFTEYDKTFAFTPLQFLQRFNKVDSLTGTSLEIWGVDKKSISQASQNLNGKLLMQASQSSANQSFVVDNVLNSGAVYFSWLELLDTNVVVIIVLIGIVAAFTLISSLFIIILERVNTIGLLKALGGSNSLITKIFVCIAEKLVLRGMIIGNIIGLGLLYLQSEFHIVPLDADSYYLDYVPVEINWLYVLIINIATLAISCAVLFVPAGTIAKLSPTKSLRFD